MFDFGQNMVGWTRLKVQGEAGTELELSFAERLNPDGTVYRENLTTTSRFGKKIAATPWGDAGIICPYILYRTYGDTRAIERHYANMKKHLLAVAGDDANGFRKRTAWGDWLNVGGSINNVVCALAYQIHLADLMAEMAGTIGKSEDVAAFRTLATKSRAIFAAECIAEDGSTSAATSFGTKRITTGASKR